MNAVHPTIAGFLRPWMPTAACPNNKRLTAADIQGLHEYKVTINGVVLDCYFDYEAAECVTFCNPGQSEKITLIHALADGVPVYGLLGEDDIEKCEDSARQAMQTKKASDDYDRGADRYEERMSA